MASAAAPGPPSGQAVRVKRLMADRRGANPIDVHCCTIGPRSFGRAAGRAGYAPRITRGDLRRIRLALVCVCVSVVVGCSGGVTTPSPPSGNATITFSNLTANRAVVGTYTESGYTVSAGPGEWVTLTTYESPAPFVQFTAASGAAVTGQLAIVAPGHATFTFKSADFYSSVTRIPYESSATWNRARWTFAQHPPRG